LILALFAATIAVAPAHAQDAQSTFDRAVAAYQRGEYDSALVAYRRLVQQGIDDARVWHGIGNCYYYMGHIGRALIAYKRGLRVAPRDGDLHANFRFVRLYAVDKIEPVGEFFLENWWQTLVERLSVHETRWLAGIFFWLAVGMTVWRLWPGREMRRIIMPLVLVWSLWALATGAAATVYYRDVVTKRGAIVVTETNVRGGPGSEYALQFVAHDGLMGVAERSQAGWYLVRFPNGLKGWVSASDFEVI
jgi:tetratricopeptide (TPR) repeat protein